MWHKSAETFEHEQNRNTAETGADKLQLIHFLLKWADVRLESQHIALWLLVWYQTNTKYDRGVNPRWDDMKKKSANPSTDVSNLQIVFNSNVGCFKCKQKQEQKKKWHLCRDKIK